jgi:hypothetical protein
MKTDLKLWLLALAVYLLIAVVAFGHAWNTVQIRPFPSGTPDTPSQFLSSFFCGLGWPVYLSVCLQEPKKVEE